MKTLTIKTAQNIPTYPSYIIEVDGKKIGEMKAGTTAYFDVDENSKSILAKLQGSRTEILDISANRHHLLIIDYKKELIQTFILVGIFLLLSQGMTFLFQLQIHYNMLINVTLAGMLYLIFKKTSFNGMKISIAEN
ncbi:hypothetical protein [Frigoriflavimonas asaccharolytica]|uniref:Uncharacterized protein n=1 Tax=Frigoriflavimonas asaccharolytica TaxID=2735899 RepID=A0A8J8G8R9_9FLAO|nr:hypothetical protein [Frigoriflavimonas asaccharolytica]NRS93416.1 hypothetical protein [Frigoriflavimonas asaccharolytica]